MVNRIIPFNFLLFVPPLPYTCLLYAICDSFSINVQQSTKLILILIMYYPNIVKKSRREHCKHGVVPLYNIIYIVLPLLALPAIYIIYMTLCSLLTPLLFAREDLKQNGVFPSLLYTIHQARRYDPL